jgi:uncharacterized protein GlcG (DUF336 family)
MTLLWLMGATAFAQQPPQPPPAPPYGAPITLAQARRVIAAAEAESIRLHVSPTFVVCDSGGRLVLFEKMDDSDLGNGDIVIAMAKSALDFRRPTKDFAEAVARNPAEAFLPGVVPFQGGWPLVVDGKVIGALGLTGTRGVRLPDGRPSGEVIAEAALAALK